MTKHSLPEIPYNYDALEPHFDARTMEIHHQKHHQAYIDKLNAALEKHPSLFSKPIRELLTDLSSIPEDIRVAVKNHGGGHYNHSLFWPSLLPNGNGEPKPEAELQSTLADAFGSFESFKEKFTASALGVFGSGWAWLVKKPDGGLDIVSTPLQDNPISNGLEPLLGLDVWEHAYYLKFQSYRAEYVAAWWRVINWPEVSSRLSTANS